MNLPSLIQVFKESEIETYDVVSGRLWLIPQSHCQLIMMGKR